MIKWQHCVESHTVDKELFFKTSNYRILMFCIETRPTACAKHSTRSLKIKETTNGTHRIIILKWVPSKLNFLICPAHSGQSKRAGSNLFTLWGKKNYVPEIHVDELKNSKFITQNLKTCDKVGWDIRRSFPSCLNCMTLQMETLFGFNTLRTGLLNCLNAGYRGLNFRHRASCI